jgi:hypothetical protein
VDVERKFSRPLSPSGWQLTFDGKSVSLYPSIGSWSLPCQSHYFITKNKVEWAPQWSKRQVAHGRAQEVLAKQRYYENLSKKRVNLWQNFKEWLLGN